MEQREYFQLILWTELPKSTENYPLLVEQANSVFGIVVTLIRHVNEHLKLNIKDENFAGLHVFSTIHGYASLMSSGKLTVFEYNLGQLEQHADTIAHAVFNSMVEQGR